MNELKNVICQIPYTDENIGFSLIAFFNQQTLFPTDYVPSLPTKVFFDHLCDEFAEISNIVLYLEEEDNFTPDTVRLIKFGNEEERGRRVFLYKDKDKLYSLEESRQDLKLYGDYIVPMEQGNESRYSTVIKEHSVMDTRHEIVNWQYDVDDVGNKSRGLLCNVIVNEEDWFDMKTKDVWDILLTCSTLEYESEIPFQICGFSEKEKVIFSPKCILYKKGGLLYIPQGVGVLLKGKAAGHLYIINKFNRLIVSYNFFELIQQLANVCERSSNIQIYENPLVTDYRSLIANSLDRNLLDLHASSYIGGECHYTFLNTERHNVPYTLPINSILKLMEGVYMNQMVRCPGCPLIMSLAHLCCISEFCIQEAYEKTDHFTKRVVENFVVFLNRISCPFIPSFNNEKELYDLYVNVNYINNLLHRHNGNLIIDMAPFLPNTPSEPLYITIEDWQEENTGVIYEKTMLYLPHQ